MKQARSAQAGVLTGAHRWLTGLVTLTAALFALLVNARNLGLTPWLGLIDLNYADQVARRIVVTPDVDTLGALGDTTILGAIATDANGGALVGARLRWRSLDSAVAQVDSTGAVVARAPGQVEIEASVKQVVGRAVIHVLQRPANVVIADDSVVRLLEGDSARLSTQVLDARGRRVIGAQVRWQSTDSSVAVVDSSGTARALGPGRSYLWASAGDIRSRLRLDVALKPAALVLESGEGQRAVAGRLLPEPVVVRVRSRGGLPVSGAAVTAQAGEEGGTIDPASATTNADGKARFVWTLSPRAGMQRIQLHLDGVDSSLQVGAEADPAPGNVKVEIVSAASGGPVGRELSLPVVVRVTDTSGLALALVRLHWAAGDGGSATGPGRTDSSGGAQAYWNLGNQSGRQRLRVQVGNPRLTPVTEITATATPGEAARVALSGKPGSTKGSLRLTALVTDEHGNAVPAESVAFRVSAGTLSTPQARSDGAGRAVVDWHPPVAGKAEVKITATVVGTRLTASHIVQATRLAAR
jgi:hypothetical protein